MINAILGKKLEMGQKFLEDGRRIPVTRIQAGPCPVVAMRTAPKDGYTALVLGFGERKEKRIKKPELGLFQKAGLKERPAFLREVGFDGEVTVKAGDLVKAADVLKVGDIVDVSGISKGKGFAGVVKRWSFAGGPKTHGQSDRERAPGSIGSTTTPGRVYKGKKMGGRMGTVKVTVRHLEVVGLDAEKNILEVKGAIPGVTGRLVMIKRSEGKL